MLISRSCIVSINLASSRLLYDLKMVPTIFSHPLITVIFYLTMHKTGHLQVGMSLHSHLIKIALSFELSLEKRLIDDVYSKLILWKIHRRHLMIYQLEIFTLRIPFLPPTHVLDFWVKLVWSFMKCFIQILLATIP